jgi:hypothetical protein
MTPLSAGDRVHAESETGALIAGHKDNWFAQLDQIGGVRPPTLSWRVAPGGSGKTEPLALIQGDGLHFACIE